jgi:hypothetical protein
MTERTTKLLKQVEASTALYTYTLTRMFSHVRHRPSQGAHTMYMFDTLATFHLLMSPLNVGCAVLDG